MEKECELKKSLSRNTRCGNRGRSAGRRLKEHLAGTHVPPGVNSLQDAREDRFLFCRGLGEGQTALKSEVTLADRAPLHADDSAANNAGREE